MPIDVARVAGAALPETRSAWKADDVILYHLGVGAGTPPTDSGELEYAYEKHLKVLPSYGVLPAMGALLELLRAPGMDVNLAHLLHGEQDVELHEPLPIAAAIVTESQVTGVYDKGKAALVVLETVSRDGEDNRPLFTNRFSAFFRGEGGFGGDSGPATASPTPDRAPDLVVACPTLPQQALLYRLSGDKNPLHADPAFAAKAGFDQPILHGLCTYGLVCKAVVDHALDGDVSHVAGYGARFAGVVFPGETVEVAMWHEDGRVLTSARAVERDAPVIVNGSVRLTSTEGA